MASNKEEYRIVGAYDSETTNYLKNNKKVAFPILHQLGYIDCEIAKINSKNVEEQTTVKLFRKSSDLFQELDNLVIQNRGYVPVICCHNLSFDMYSLASWLNKYDVRVLAKSQRKPISFTILVDDKPKLVIWDTLVFSQKSLDYMGQECHYKKLVGAWDYDLIRTPETLLTDDEVAYAKHDIYTLLAWLGYWCRLNPDLDPKELGYRIVTKTGIVRRKRVLRFGKLKSDNLNKSVSQFWNFINNKNTFASDDELYTCIASTRGGLTFCSRKNASKVFDFTNEKNKKVYGFDATSQHPSQIVSHKYPVNFRHAKSEDLDQAFKNISMITLDHLLEHYNNPFKVAFYGCFEFRNLRLKKGSLFEKGGLALLASARCMKDYQIETSNLEENQNGEEFKKFISSFGYKDQVKNGKFAFGKLESAEIARLYITELTAWEIIQAYDFDSVKAVDGYITLEFNKPSDMALISVMQFYEAKNEFKIAREKFYKNEMITNSRRLLKLGIPDFVVNGMMAGNIDESIIESTYLSLKADLNALFGIEACNEYRRDTILGREGIEYEGEFGICNMPKHPKAWYQFGQRIVGWSRIAQIVVMLLCEPYFETIINGDTDSIKFVIKNKNVAKIEKSLDKLSSAIDKAKEIICSRIAENYPLYFSPLDEIGYYILEFSTKQFSAGWNKAYCIREFDRRDSKYHCHFTLAGIPTSRKLKDKMNVNQLADHLIENGWSFGDVCDRFLGYNTTFANDILALFARSFPKWGDFVDLEIEDYLGNVTKVKEPSVLCLYPMAKTINDTNIRDNLNNQKIAIKNRKSLCIDPAIITTKEIIKVSDLIEA